MTLAQIMQFTGGDPEFCARLNSLVALINAAARRVSESGKFTPDAMSSIAMPYRIESKVSGAAGFYVIATTDGDADPDSSGDIVEGDVGAFGSGDVLGLNLTQIKYPYAKMGVGDYGIGVILGRCGEESEFPGALVIGFAGPSSTTIPVRVSQDGGAGGDGVTAASWTYAISDIDGDEDGPIAEHVGVQRFYTRQMNKAPDGSLGLAIRTGPDAYTLVVVAETIVLDTDCDEDPTSEPTSEEPSSEPTSE